MKVLSVDNDYYKISLEGDIEFDNQIQFDVDVVVFCSLPKDNNQFLSFTDFECKYDRENCILEAKIKKGNIYAIRISYGDKDDSYPYKYCSLILIEAKDNDIVPVESSFNYKNKS